MAPNFPDSRRNWMDCPGGENTGVTRGSLMARRISRRDCARDWIKSTLRIRKKRQIFQATRVELAKLQPLEMGARTGIWSDGEEETPGRQNPT